LAKTKSGKVILVEAKAYIQESVDYRSKASSESSREKIKRALSEAKKGFTANKDASWETPFYQYANRLAHLYFLKRLNGVDAYILFLYFADAPDVRVEDRTSTEQWEGAIRLTKKCLGISDGAMPKRVCSLIWDGPYPTSATL
jgi:hypothetical protein